MERAVLIVLAANLVGLIGFLAWKARDGEPFAGTRSIVALARQALDLVLR